MFYFVRQKKLLFSKKKFVFNVICKVSLEFAKYCCAAASFQALITYCCFNLDYGLHVFCKNIIFPFFGLAIFHLYLTTDITVIYKNKL